MLLQPTGDVSPCCWNQKIKYGNVKNASLLDLWNSPEAISLRKEFMAGNPISCSKQIAEIGCHKRSHGERIRQTEITR